MRNYTHTRIASMLVTIIVMVVGLSILTISHTWKSYPQDNIVEEIVEDVIKVETGEDVDLSPQSPEQ